MFSQVWMAWPQDGVRYMRLRSDQVDESDPKYCVFLLDGEVIGRVMKEHILGWWVDERGFEKTDQSDSEQ